MKAAYRPDGWPLCPQCGDDELMSELTTVAATRTLEEKARQLLRATPSDPMLCLSCLWRGFVPVRGPKIICLCGSTRFIETFAIQTWELERKGYIVLGCTLLPRWYCKVPDHFGEATGTKTQCDELHLRKIDLADEVLVLNVGGYIGESTTNEIAYATAHGKPVSYLERPKR